MNLYTAKAAFVPVARPRHLGIFALSRRRLRAVLMVGVPLLLAAIAFAAWFSGGRYAATDDAYVRAPKLMVSADVSGLVAEVSVHEGQKVRKGDVLFRIDPKQFQIAVDDAKASSPRPPSTCRQ